MKRGFFGLFISTILVFMSVTQIYAASNLSADSIVLCYNQNNEIMGGAILYGEFEYADGSYVIDTGVGTYYQSYLSNTSCIFDDITSGHNSARDYAYASCYYLCSDDYCYDFGALEVTCNEYGETEDLGGCIRRGYTN